MKSGRTGSITAVIVAAIGALVLVFSRSAAVETAYPVAHAARSFRNGVWSRIVGLFGGSAAEAENVRLQREIASLRVLRGDLDRLEKENARLRRALGYAEREPGSWIPAAVLSAGGGATTVRDSIRVDKGTLAGVRPGAVVVVPEGLVGRVTTVSPHTADVALLTDPSVRVACEIETGEPHGLGGVLSGGGEDQLLLRHLRWPGRDLPQARVFTSGRGGVFPRGIEVGTLLGITNTVRGVVGDVRPHVGFSTLEDVFIRREN